ncbi:nuclear body protein SP140-like isoform X1 [Danio aesculapii]|nr:nuclear body protein SP140-like isoform X1 [Danio aesculapii]
MNTRQQKQQGVYEVLEWLEKERSQEIRSFWNCVFEDHIMQMYPTLHLLKKSLLEDVIGVSKELLGSETPPMEANERMQRNNDDSSEDSGDPGPSSASTLTRKRPANKPSFSTPVKKGDKRENCMLSKTESQLPVNCGNEEGILYSDKLAKGEKCILAQERWFSPSEFEKFAGKERNKNWKYSIRCAGAPLKKLIEEDHLQTSPMKRRKRKCVRNSKKVQIADSSESSNPDSKPDFQQQRRRAGLRSQIRSRVDDEDDEDEIADLTVFQAPTLPVTCVSLTGTLYKKRFATGKRGKSIRTEERWFTPEEFVKEEPTLIDGLWKRDILCHGKTLNFLCKKKILQIHSLLCECLQCSTDSEDLMDQNNDDLCYACHSRENLACCDKCPRAFHHHCHLPAVPKGSSGDWSCTFCLLRTSLQCRAPINMSEQEAFDAPVSEYIQRCRYLLLCMYKEDIQKVFVEDPRQNVDRYSEFISQPMWLDRIKTKLESKKYQKVGEFVSDIRLIFSNCRKFNRDNKFGQLGTKMKEIFEEEIQKIFFIQ